MNIFNKSFRKFILSSILLLPNTVHAVTCANIKFNPKLTIPQLPKPAHEVKSSLLTTTNRELHFSGPTSSMHNTYPGPDFKGPKYYAYYENNQTKYSSKKLEDLYVVVQQDMRDKYMKDPSKCVLMVYDNKDQNFLYHAYFEIK